MANTFEIALRSKTAEQLVNMKATSSNWDSEQYAAILLEIKNRGLTTFEEPEAWQDGQMEALDMINPKSEFEKNIAFLAEDKIAEEGRKGLVLAANILTIAALLLSFVSYLFFDMAIVELKILSITCAFISLGLFIGKSHLASVILACVSLLFTLIVLLLFAKDYFI